MPDESAGAVFIGSAMTAKSADRHSRRSSSVKSPSGTTANGAVQRAQNSDEESFSAPHAPHRTEAKCAAGLDITKWLSVQAAIDHEMIQPRPAHRWVGPRAELVLQTQLSGPISFAPRFK
jgi:hypothetical protein